MPTFNYTQPISILIIFSTCTSLKFRLGIDCLVREAANAKVPRDLGAIVYRYSGEPVGAFFQLNERDQLVSGVMIGLAW